MKNLTFALAMLASSAAFAVEYPVPEDGGYRPDPRGNQFNTGNPAQNVYVMPSTAAVYPEPDPVISSNGE